MYLLLVGKKIPIPNLVVRTKLELSLFFSIFLFIETWFYFLKEQNPKLSSYHKTKEPHKIIKK
jgi:hypothetical protein